MRSFGIRLATGGATVALALLLTSCGGGGGGGGDGDGDGDSMTVQEVCDSMTDVAAAFDDDDWPALQQGWEDLGERRLPDEIPPLAQQGVRVYVDMATRSDSMDSYRAKVDQPSPEDREALTAVEDFYGTTCG